MESWIFYVVLWYAHGCDNVPDYLQINSEIYFINVMTLWHYDAVRLRLLLCDRYSLFFLVLHIRLKSKVTFWYAASLCLLAF